MAPEKSTSDYFVETRLGIVSRRGDWFHTTSDHIEAYAPGLLETVSLQTLVQTALAWIYSTSSLSLLLLFGLLFSVNPFVAAGFTVLFHGVWYHFKSGFVIRGMRPFWAFINSDGFLYVVAFLALSLLSLSGAYVATGVGIAFFFVLKFGLLRWVWEKLALTENASSLTLNDRVLKMVIIKESMKSNTAPANIQAMEERFIRVATNRKNKD